MRLKAIDYLARAEAYIEAILPSAIRQRGLALDIWGRAAPRRPVLMGTVGSDWLTEGVIIQGDLGVVRSWPFARFEPEDHTDRRPVPQVDLRDPAQEYVIEVMEDL
jgi:hypothetical protein